MMRHISWRAIALATALIALPGLVSAQPESIRIGKKGEIELNQPMRVGTTLLQSGHYEVQHAFVDGQHYVVFRERIQPARRHNALTTGNEVARVPCRIITLDRLPRSSVAYWTRSTDGMAAITEIRIVEEPAGHIIALAPSSAQ